MKACPPCDAVNQCVHFRSPSPPATATCDSRCSAVRQRSFLPTDWSARVRHQAPLKCVIAPSRPLEDPPPCNDWSAPLGRCPHPLAEGAWRFVACGLQLQERAARVTVIDDIPSSSRQAIRPAAKAVGTSFATETTHEDAAENPSESACLAAHTQHRGAIPRTSGGCPGSSGSPAGSRASARVTAYIGRNRWPKARLTFSGLCSPRTLRL